MSSWERGPLSPGGPRRAGKNDNMAAVAGDSPVKLYEASWSSSVQCIKLGTKMLLFFVNFSYLLGTKWRHFVYIESFRLFVPNPSRRDSLHKHAQPVSFWLYIQLLVSSESCDHENKDLTKLFFWKIPKDRSVSRRKQTQLTSFVDLFPSTSRIVIPFNFPRNFSLQSDYSILIVTFWKWKQLSFSTGLNVHPRLQHMDAGAMSTQP